MNFFFKILHNNSPIEKFSKMICIRFLWVMKVNFSFWHKRRRRKNSFFSRTLSRLRIGSLVFFSLYNSSLLRTRTNSKLYYTFFFPGIFYVFLFFFYALSSHHRRFNFSSFLICNRRPVPIPCNLFFSASNGKGESNIHA